jgi:hypothetical protein
MRRARPPRPEPRTEPMLPKADLIDIMVPLNWGTCSMVKLVEAVDLKPMKIYPVRPRANETHRLGTMVVKSVKSPAVKADTSVTGFLPNLFTNLLLIRAPRV